MTDPFLCPPEAVPGTLLLLITVPQLEGDATWVWRCEGEQRFVYQRPGSSIGFVEEPDFDMRPLCVEAHSICALMRVRFQGLDQLVGGGGVMLVPHTDPMRVVFPAFTRREPLELTFAHAPNGASFGLYLDPRAARDRIAKLSEPKAGEQGLWWLSYADEKGSRGVVLVRADTFLDACAESRRLGAAPGGQVLGSPFPEHILGMMDEGLIGRLISPKEASELDDKIEAALNG